MKLSRKRLKFMIIMSKPRRVFEPSFKQKAVELSYARSHVREVAEERELQIGLQRN